MLAMSRYNTRVIKGKTIVIKYGGAAMQSEELKAGVMEDACALVDAGADVVLVHGGGPELTALQERLGIETRFVDGLRYTDEETMDAALMALCGKVNKDLVRLLENLGHKAVGISGVDGCVLKCVRQLDPDIGLVGEICEVVTELLQTLLGAGYIPVVSTVGLGEDGLVYNINADSAAGRIAAGLSADFFVTLSDVPGLLRDAGDPGSLIPEVRAGEIEGLIESGAITGGMIPKTRGIADAIKYGADSVTIIDGRVPHALREWAKGAKAGTRFTDG